MNDKLTKHLLRIAKTIDEEQVYLSIFDEKINSIIDNKKKNTKDKIFELRMLLMQLKEFLKDDQSIFLMKEGERHYNVSRIVIKTIKKNIKKKIKELYETL